MGIFLGQIERPIPHGCSSDMPGFFSLFSYSNTGFCAGSLAVLLRGSDKNMGVVEV
jgi:hypothetical protein